jgi:hypothetical protein
MIDETNFFNLGSGAAEETRKWHEQHLKNRHRPMALLLTETVNPEALAEDVLRSLAMEEAPLLRLRAEHERMMAQWRSENPAANPDDPFEGMSYWEIKEKFFTVDRAPFMPVRKVIDEALGRIGAERQNCKDRLAARLRDRESGRVRSQIDAQEEPDPLLRMHASRLREQQDTYQDVLKLREMEREHMKRMLEIRMKSPWPKLSE